MLVDKIAKMMSYFDEVNENLSDFLTQKEKTEGRMEDLPKIDENHKSIIFREWEIKMKHAVTTINEVQDLSSSIN